MLEATLTQTADDMHWQEFAKEWTITTYVLSLSGQLADFPSSTTQTVDRIEVEQLEETWRPHRGRAREPLFGKHIRETWDAVRGR